MRPGNERWFRFVAWAKFLKESQVIDYQCDCVKTLHFLFALNQASAGFVIRQHGTPSRQPLGQLVFVGQTKTGKVFEPPIPMEYQGTTLQLRRLVVRLRNDVG